MTEFPAPDPPPHHIRPQPIEHNPLVSKEQAQRDDEGVAAEDRPISHWAASRDRDPSSNVIRHGRRPDDISSRVGRPRRQSLSVSQIRTLLKAAGAAVVAVVGFVTFSGADDPNQLRPEYIAVETVACGETASFHGGTLDITITGCGGEGGAVMEVMHGDDPLRVEQVAVGNEDFTDRYGNTIFVQRLGGELFRIEVIDG